MTTELGRRERKKQQTRQLLTDTARRLFAERGFADVSVAEIAEAADVAVATVFNYFPTKEDLVFSRLGTFEDELLTAVRERAPDESVLAAFGRFVLEPRGLLSSESAEAVAELTAITRVIATSPPLLAREQQVFARYTDALASLIARETRAGPSDPRPYVAANALIGVHRTLIHHVRGRILDGERDLPALARETRALGRRALALLEHGLADYGRPARARRRDTSPSYGRPDLNASALPSERPRVRSRARG